MTAETTQGSKIAQGLLTAQKAIGEVKKDAENTYHGYKYTSADEMVRVARAALHASGLTLTLTGHDFSVLPEIQAVFSEDDAVPPYIFVTSHFSLEHESGERRAFDFTLPAIPGSGRPLDKAILGCMTTSTAYVLRDLLQIPRQDENEISGRDDTQTPAPRRQPQQTWSQKKAETSMSAPPPPQNKASVKARVWGTIAAWSKVPAAESDKLGQAGKLVYDYLKIDTAGHASDADLERLVRFVMEQQRKGVDFAAWAAERAEASEAEKVLGTPKADPKPTDPTHIDEKDLPF